MVEVLPEGEEGVAKIDHFTMDPSDILASIMEHDEDFVPAGRYASLRVNGQLMMTDSPMEKRADLDVVGKAHGRVLIAGLGLGMILRAIAKKPEVTHITVLEKYPDVIDLVLPSLVAEKHLLVSGFVEDGHRVVAGTRLEVIPADVFHWEALPGTPRFHTIYFDIWPNSLIANLPEMHLLHRRYHPLLAKGGWMSSWTYKQLIQKERDYKRFIRGLPALLERHWKEHAHTPDMFVAKLRQLLLALDDGKLRGGKLSNDEKLVIRQFAAAKGIEL
jgi:hypothetical protein